MTPPDKLPAVDSQPLTARLAGAGAMLTEIEAVLQAVDEDATVGDYRRAILENNAARKGSQTARMWAWKRLKLRYALDVPRSPEFRAFRRAMRALSPTDRGFSSALMMARTDRLFRETTLAVLSPRLARSGTEVDPGAVETDVEARMADAGLRWSDESRRSITNHVLSSWTDFGFIAGIGMRHTTAVHPGPSTVRFAVELARLEGLTDRQALDSQWFRILGLDRPDVDELLLSAARSGALGYRAQAEVVEIELPEAS